MAWNQPGSTGDKDPWGHKRKANQPFDIDRLLRDLQNRVRAIFGGRGGEPGGAGFGISLIVGVAIVVWLLTGLYIVQQGERGVVLRFGQKSDVTTAGLHWRVPYPIERVEKVNVEAVSQFGIGYRTDTRSGAKVKEPRESLMLTGDENIVDVGVNVQYQIKDAEKYLFNVHDSESTIRQATESAVREIVGRSTMDAVLAEEREQMQAGVKQLLQKILDRYDAGIYIVSVNVPSAQPPDEVRAAVDDVNKAREDKERQKNEAEAYANDIVPRARGAAARLIQEAEGYKASTMARADGDARRFAQVANEYVKAPAVTRERLYIETMEQVLSKSTKVFVDQKGGNNLIYLPLDKLVPAAEASTSAAPSAPTEPEVVPAKPAPSPRGRGELRSRGTTP